MARVADYIGRILNWLFVVAWLASFVSMAGMMAHRHSGGIEGVVFRSAIICVIACGAMAWLTSLVRGEK